MRKGENKSLKKKVRKMCHNGSPGSWYRLWCMFEASTHMERATEM